MKKQLMIVGIVVILLAVGLCGCNEQENKVDSSKFIGAWKLVDVSYEPLKNLLDEQSHFWEIMENGSIKQTTTHYNDPDNESDNYISIYWNIWELTDDKFNMRNETARIPYDYQFSDSYSILKLTYSELVWYKLEKI